jgi:hypothetical protein
MNRGRLSPSDKRRNRRGLVSARTLTMVARHRQIRQKGEAGHNASVSEHRGNIVRAQRSKNHDELLTV